MIWTISVQKNSLVRGYQKASSSDIMIIGTLDHDSGRWWVGLLINTKKVTYVYI